MKRFKNIIVLLATLVLLTSGCNQANQTSEKKESKEFADNAKLKQVSGESKDTNTTGKVTVVSLPKTYEELSTRPVGEQHDFTFTLNEKNIKEMLNTFGDLPDISKSPTNKELDYFYQKLLAKVQREYKGPEEAIRQLRFQSIGDPQMEDARYQFKENLNVEIILDASGSMAQSVAGRVKMDSAKASILNFVTQLPKNANVGIRVYGHKGSNADSDKQISCNSSEMMYSISSYDEMEFKSALNNINPTGWTPIELALNEAKRDLSQFDAEHNTNIIYLVSDGVSTCDDNPVAAAKELYNSNISPIVNVIGFDVDSKGQNQLREIANATDGLYANVADENQLGKELSKINNLAETWAKWKVQGVQSIELKKVSNSIDIFVYITQEESKRTQESSIINLILSQFWQNDLMSVDSRVYLEKKNSSYHDWIKGEIEKFNTDLKALNEKSYGDALKVLEDKYQQNAQ